VDDNYETRPETSSHSSKSYTDPICLEDDKSDTAMGASTQDDSVVENESDNIVIEQNIKDVQLEDDETIEIVFYETNEHTDVFSELFAESFVAATTPFFHPDTHYDDFSAGSIFESANVNMAMDKACQHLTLDPGGDTSNVINGKVKELEESFAADADPPMDILPNREAIDGVLPSLVINLIPTAVKMSPAMHGLIFSKPLYRHNAKSMVNTMDRNTKDSTSGKLVLFMKFHPIVMLPTHARFNLVLKSMCTVVPWLCTNPMMVLSTMILKLLRLVTNVALSMLHVQVDKDCVLLSRQVCTFVLILSLSLPVSMVISLTKAALIVQSADIKHLIIVPMIEARFPAQSVKV
jgi:hypothetical protein